MAKRMIEPDWKKLRILPECLQRAWFYIWDKADAAGVYDYDPEYMKLDLKLNEAISLSEFTKLPECEILPGNRILIKNFLAVNYKQLRPDYNPHKPAFRALEKNGLTLNSSLNQACIKLEEVDADEDKDEEVDFGKPENLFEPKGIVADMVMEFKKHNPEYAFDEKQDFPALFEMAGKIFKWKKLSGNLLEPINRTSILLRWGELTLHAAAEPHLSTYSITRLNNHFQSLVQSFNNGGKKTRKSGDNRAVVTGRSTTSGQF